MVWRAPLVVAKRFAFRGFGVLPQSVRRFVIHRVTPTWTAGALAIIERPDGRWLMVRPVYRKGWAFPGGLLNRGEDPATALRRELVEELGLDVELAEGPWIIYDSAMRRIDTVFRATVADDGALADVSVRTAELDAVGWFDPTDPPDAEDEALDAIRLAAQVAGGGSRILWR